VPAARVRFFVLRQRWFTLIDPDVSATERMHAFARAFEATVPRVKAYVTEWCAQPAPSSISITHI
jgi:hypothetical protein